LKKSEQKWSVIKNLAYNRIEAKCFSKKGETGRRNANVKRKGKDHSSRGGDNT